MLIILSSFVLLKLSPAVSDLFKKKKCTSFALRKSADVYVVLFCRRALSAACQDGAPCQLSQQWRS